MYEYNKCFLVELVHFHPELPKEARIHNVTELLCESWLVLLLSDIIITGFAATRRIHINPTVCIELDAAHTL